MFDFSEIPSLESILTYSIGGISVGALVVLAIKVLLWLKNNNVKDAVSHFAENIIGRDINVDLTVLAEKRFDELNKRVERQLERLEQMVVAQSAVMVDVADVVAASKMTSEAQRERFAEHTKPIRIKEPAPAREVVTVRIEPVKRTKKDEPKTTVII